MKHIDINQLSNTSPNLSVVVPGGCSCSCSFCFWKPSPMATPKVYWDNLKALLGNALPSNFYQVSITGAEPTESPHLAKILKAIDRKRFTHTVLTTNGTYLHKFLDKLPGVIDHVNISRHAMDGNLNAEIFGSSAVPTLEEIETLRAELNDRGIDLTLCAVLTPKAFKTTGDITNYIAMARDVGAQQVFFRIPHGSLGVHPLEKAFREIKFTETSCPVCRTRTQLIQGMRVSWKASAVEPTAKVKGVWEAIYRPNGLLTADWAGKTEIVWKQTMSQKKAKASIALLGLPMESYSGCHMPLSNCR